MANDRSENPMSGVEEAILREESNEIILAGLEELQRRLYEWSNEYHPKRKQKVPYLAMHLAEEAGEAVGCVRQGKISETFAKDVYGLKHPEGLGSELADTMGVCLQMFARAGVDLDSVILKLEYLEAKLAAKKHKRSKKGKK